MIPDRTITAQIENDWRSLMERGRMRGDHEDTHNSLKNRGFAGKHDYAKGQTQIYA